MKKNLLTLGVLVLSLGQVSAQIDLINAKKGGKVYVKQSTLISGFGSLDIQQGGLVDNAGNISLKGGSADKITIPNKNHFILRLNEEEYYDNYGQLKLQGYQQSNISGSVDKEYRDSSHGEYQQLALPFYQKTFGDLNTEVPGLGLTDTRFISGKATGKNILMHDNRYMVSHLATLASKTSKPAQYYIVGTKGFDPAYFPNNTTTFVGVPVANGVSEVLVDAAKGVNFGTDGKGKNQYKQLYKNYVTDAWDSNNAWKGSFGRDIYQYGNPYLMNIDLTMLDDATRGNIRGIRYSIENTSTNLSNIASSQARYINFTKDGDVAAGDVDGAIIKPMGVFVVKLKENAQATINFDDLRTFSYTASKPTGVYKGVNKSLNRRSGRVVASTNGTVKQLDVIALDANKKEIDRTYYVVYPQGLTGYQEEAKTVQTVASSTNVIGTFEESIDGGIDTNVQDKYWLYINEANENDFKGKKVPMYIYSKDVAYLKFVVRENAKKLEKGDNLSTGESFYVSTGKKNAQKVSQGDIIPVSGYSYGLYYGNPDSSTLATDNVAVSKPSNTVVVLDVADNQYKLLFDETWKTADVQIFDITGKLVEAQQNIKTQNPFILNIPREAKSTFVVVATSESGQKFSQKVKSN